MGICAERIAHFDGKAWAELSLVPGSASAECTSNVVPILTSAGPGAVWVGGGAVLRVHADGRIEDFTSQVATVGYTGGWSYALSGHGNDVYVQSVVDTYGDAERGPRLFEFDGNAFQRIPWPGYALGQFHVRKHHDVYVEIEPSSPSVFFPPPTDVPPPGRFAYWDGVSWTYSAGDAIGGSLSTFSRTFSDGEIWIFGGALATDTNLRFIVGERGAFRETTTPWPSRDGEQWRADRLFRSSKGLPAMISGPVASADVSTRNRASTQQEYWTVEWDGTAWVRPVRVGTATVCVGPDCGGYSGRAASGELDDGTQVVSNLGESDAKLYLISY